MLMLIYKDERMKKTYKMSENQFILFEIQYFGLKSFDGN